MKSHVLIAIVLAGAVPAAAQPAAEPLTIEDAIARGLQASHRLEEAAARGDAARAVVDQRRAAALPVVQVQAGYTRTNHVDEFGVPAQGGPLRVIYPDLPDNYRSRLDLQWPLYNGGRLQAVERAARGEAAAAASELDAARSDLRLEITRTYWALVTAVESVRVVDQAVERIRAHLGDVRSQFDAGLIPPNDVLTVEAQESRQRLLAVQARVTRDTLEAELARLIGAPATAITPVSMLTPPTEEPGAPDAAIAAARESRHDRRALADRVRAAADREAAVRAGRRPTIGVAAGLDYANPNPRIFPREDRWRTAWDASVNINWPVFDGGRVRAEVAEASAAARAVQARLDEFDALLEVEVRQRLAELAASRTAIAAAADGVGAAAEARRVAGERFAAGVATSTDVLDTQVALLQAELDRAQALANARVAEARFVRAVGR
jgi:outer membrane protein TolC